MMDCLLFNGSCIVVQPASRLCKRMISSLGYIQGNNRVNCHVFRNLLSNHSTNEVCACVCARAQRGGEEDKAK